MTYPGRSKPDPDSTPAPSQPRRLPSNRQRSSKLKKKQASVRFAEVPLSSSNNDKGNDDSDVRAMKEQQNTLSQNSNRAQQKAAEDAATRMATEASLSHNQCKQGYDSGKWEQLVSKQEELMNSWSEHDGDSKPKRSNSNRQQQQRSRRQRQSRNNNINNTTTEERTTTVTPPVELAHSIPAPVPPVPALTRGRQQQQQEHILPGAFRMRPSMGATPALGLEEGENANDFMHQDSRRTLTSHKSETIRVDDDVLIEAELVSEDTEMPSSSSTNSTRRSQQQQPLQQQPIYPEPELVMGEPMSLMKLSVEEDEEEKERKRRLRWILIAVCLLVCFIVIAGSVLFVRANKEDQQDGSASSSSASTPPPPMSYYGGSGSPTMAPTAFTQSVLPSFTQEALNDPTSPQSQAYSWFRANLENNADHQDMHTFFPLQRFVLATLYYSMQGSSWKDNEGWLQEETEPCDWYTTFYGVICTNGRRRKQRNLREAVVAGSPRRYYQRLSLYQNNLAGTLPPQIGLLTKLDVVDLHGNAISGSVPSELGLWQDVTLFQIFNNTLTGTLPAQLSQLTRIRHLNFAFNQLTGTIPTALAQLSSTMEVFSVSNNLVTGTIPSQLGLLTNMVGLHLYGNPHLSGSIPSQLAQMTLLQKLHLNAIENLIGTLPSQLGKLVELHELQLEDTNLQGPIPSTLGSLSQLTKLTMHNTDLTGSLPDQICSLVQAGTLKTLSVDCEKVQCPQECQCNCHDAFPPRTQQEHENSVSGGGDDTSATSPPQATVVAEGITDPPITVDGLVGPTPGEEEDEENLSLESTSGAVGGGSRPRPNGR